jgi:DNA-binding transcriptional regulator GbsR (MarR family)
MQQDTGAYGPSGNMADDRPRLGAVEAGFIQNWAALAQAFGMDPMLGRVHALAFLSVDPIGPAEVARALDLEEADAARHLDHLLRFGAVRAHEDGGFESDGDPWSWFLVILKERGRREFSPLVQSIREASQHAQQLRRSLGPGARELHRIQRITRFGEFVEQIAGLLETFATLGAGPMVSALRMFAKVKAPRALRI